DDDVARGERAEQSADSCRHMTVALELDQLEERHRRLADRERVEAGDELARALAAEVVDPVVAVGRDPELAEPAEEDGGRGIDVDGPEEWLVRALDPTVAGERTCALGGRRSPGVGERRMVHRLIHSL